MIDSRIITPVTGRKTVAATGTPEALQATQQAVQSVELVAQKSQGSANTSTLYVGFGTRTDTGWTAPADGACDRPMVAGDKWVITAGPGQMLDLAGIFVDVGTNADGVTWTAIP